MIANIIYFNNLKNSAQFKFPLINAFRPTASELLYTSPLDIRFTALTFIIKSI